MSKRRAVRSVFARGCICFYSPSRTGVKAWYRGRQRTTDSRVNRQSVPRRVTPPLGLDGNQRLIEEIISQADFDVVKEDKTAHKRSVKAGSHARKLQPETAAFLNQELAEVLQRMGYEEGS